VSQSLNFSFHETVVCANKLKLLFIVSAKISEVKHVFCSY